MKEFLKKYKLSVIVLVGLTFVFGFFVWQYKAKFDDNVHQLELIQKGIEDGTIQKPYEDYNPYIEYEKTDAISMYFEIVNEKYRYIINYLPLAFLLPSAYFLYKKLNFGTIRAEITRTSYKEFLKKHLKITYKSMWIVPIYILICFLFCILYTGRIDIWNAHPNFWTVYSQSSLDQEYIDILPIFLFFYVLNLILLAGYYINVLLLFMKKKMPYLVSCIASFLVVLGINIFLEIVMGIGLNIILYKWFEINPIINWNSTLNFYMYWSPGDQSNIYIQFIVAVLLFLGSGFLVYKSYNDKEKMLINYEL